MKRLIGVPQRLATRQITVCNLFSHAPSTQLRSERFFPITTMLSLN